MANDYIKLWVKDYRALLEPFNEAERGRILWAMMDYKETGSEPKFLGNERFVWAAIKAKIDASNEAYERQAAANRANGARGGRPRKSKENQENPKNRMGFEESTTEENIRRQNCSSTRAQRCASAAGRRCGFAIPAIRSKGYGPQGHSFGASRRGMESGFAVIWCTSISAIIGQNRNFMAVESGGRTERPSSSGNEVGAKKLSISCASAQSCPRCCWPPLARISRTHWRPTPTNLRMMFGKC